MWMWWSPLPPSLSCFLSLCWTVILVYFGLNYSCKNCYIAVYLLCVMNHCLYLLLFALPPLSLCLMVAATALLWALLSELLLLFWVYGALWVQEKATQQWRFRIRLFKNYYFMVFPPPATICPVIFVRVLAQLKRFIGVSSLRSLCLINLNLTFDTTFF